MNKEDPFETVTYAMKSIRFIETNRVKRQDMLWEKIVTAQTYYRIKIKVMKGSSVRNFTVGAEV